jgi:hypothetical protein
MRPSALAHRRASRGHHSSVSVTFTTSFYTESTVFNRAMRLALDVLEGRAEWECWKCGCERIHELGTCVVYVVTCERPACQRVPAPELLILTGNE